MSIGLPSEREAYKNGNSILYKRRKQQSFPCFFFYLLKRSKRLSVLVSHNTNHKQWNKPTKANILINKQTIIKFTQNTLLPCVCVCVCVGVREGSKANPITLYFDHFSRFQFLVLYRDILILSRGVFVLFHSQHFEWDLWLRRGGGYGFSGSFIWVWRGKRLVGFQCTKSECMKWGPTLILALSGLPISAIIWEC